MKLLKLYLICALGLLMRHSYAQQQDWLFDRISLKDGLSNTNVYDIFQDSKGYFWVCTQNGLNRYNAYEFQVFNSDVDDPSSINSDLVLCVFEDDENRLWIGTGGGLNEYERSTGKFISHELVLDNIEMSVQPTVTDIVQSDDGSLYLATSSNGLIKYDKNLNKSDLASPIDPSNKDWHPGFIRCLMIDSEDNLWGGTNGSGVFKYNLNSNEVTVYYSILNEKFPHELSFGFALHEDQKGDIWVGTFVGGLLKYDQSTDNFRLIPNPNNSDAITKNGVMAISETPNGQLILGTNGGGVFIFDAGTEKFGKNYLNEPGLTSSLSNDFIVTIYRDKENIIWIGTENGGLSIYNPNRRKFTAYKKNGVSKTDMPGSTVNAICEDERGIVWIGTENNGYARFNRETNEFQSFLIPNAHRQKGNTFIKTIIEDGEGGVWIGANMGGLTHVDSSGQIIQQYSSSIQVNDPHPLLMDDLRTLMMAEDGILWIGGFRSFARKKGENFKVFCENPNPNSGICSEAVSDIYELNENYLLIGYARQGIRYFNRNTEEFGPHILPGDEKYPGLSSDAVNVIFRDSQNRLWLGTNNGLNLMNEVDTTFKVYYRKQGLPSSTILGILEDEAGNLWISTNLGLSCFNPNQESFKNYYEEDGLQSNVFRFGSFFKSNSGEMFFGGVDGFNAFYPKQIRTNRKVPKIVFTDFQLFNKSIEPGENSVLKSVIEETKQIELDYDQSIFSFQFAALNYTLTEQNEYAYQLEGFDDEKQFIGNRRYITFTNIPAGEYTLKIYACNNDGVWNNEGLTLDIKINPPFWETWWFRLLMALLAIGIFTIWYRWRIRSIEIHNKKLEHQVKVRTKQVVEQKDEIKRQKDLVDQKNQDMLDSIRYSKRIQDSFIPNRSEFEKQFADSFIVFKPKDIVSGDFYWMETIENLTMLAVADCTGHGVPGAMVSVLGNNGLHQAISEKHLTDSGEILDALNSYVRKSFDKSDETVRDGMDICLCTFDLKSSKLNFAAANNPLWIIRDKELIAYKATKQPIGNYSKSISFESQEIDLVKGDWVIMFSDGFPDQFGGEKGKKYKYSTLKNKLVEVCQNKSGNEISELLIKEFEDWKGEHEQIDDVCLVGVKI